MALAIAALSFATVTMFIMFFAASAGEKDRLVSRRLARFEGGPASQYGAEMEMSFFSRIARPVLDKVAAAVGRFTPAGRVDAIRRRLAQAGNPWGLHASEFIGVKILVMVGLPLALVFLGPARPGAGGTLFNAFFVGFLAVLFAAALPELLLRRRIAARQQMITKGLPDVLDLLTVSVEAGLGFDGSLAKVAEKSEGPIAEEFRRVLQEMRMGKPRREALKDLGTRTGVADLIAFTVALIQADQLGVSIGKVLRVQSEEMRRRRRQRAEEAAMKAPIKMLFPLVLFVFPTLFIILLGPAVIQIAATFMNMQ